MALNPAARALNKDGGLITAEEFDVFISIKWAFTNILFYHSEGIFGLHRGMSIETRFRLMIMWSE